MHSSILIFTCSGALLAASSLQAQEAPSMPAEQQQAAVAGEAQDESTTDIEQAAGSDPAQAAESAPAPDSWEGAKTTQDSDEPEQEPEVELTDKAEAALDTIVFSSEDPEVARRARKQAEKEAQYQQAREQAEEAQQAEAEAPEAAEGEAKRSEPEQAADAAPKPETKPVAETAPASEAEPAAEAEPEPETEVEPTSEVEPPPELEARTGTELPGEAAPERDEEATGSADALPPPPPRDQEQPVLAPEVAPVRAESQAPEPAAKPEPSAPPDTTAVAPDVLPSESPPLEKDSPVKAVEKVSEPSFEYELYASVRLHGINTFDIETEDTDKQLGDGASRIGVALYYETKSNWEFYGRLESGFDIIDSFTPKAQVDSGAKLPIRLAHLGVDSEYFNLKAGKSWSTYYKVAGAADLFMIFGASAMGIYNAGTDGGAAGTGRADEALQTQIYVDLGRWIDFKPFNINLQYQWDQPIPKLEKETYSHIYSASTWFEHWKDIGVGFAYHRASVDDLNAQEVVAAGITGDTIARALSLRTYGDKWLASFVAGRHENLETNDRGQYIDAEAYELFFQRQLSERIWLIGGGNWLLPDEDDPEAGDFKIAYGVLGARYTFDGLRRMIYAEWKNDHGRATDGTRLKNEFTIGVRWDFGY